MLTERLAETDRPFIKVDNDVLTDPWSARKRARLETLRLNIDSTVDDARRVAISLRLKAQESGVDTKSLNTLRWVLKLTNDCQNDAEFNDFLLEGRTFEQIENARSIES